MDLVRGEKSLIGSSSHAWDQDFREALQLLGRGAVQAAPLITDRIPLSAAVTGGLALLRDEPERHLKILVGESGMSAADGSGVLPDLAVSLLYAAVVSDILDDLGHRDHTLDPAIRPLRRGEVIAGFANPFLGHRGLPDP